MPVAGGGFEQCYNAQAAMAADSLLVVAVTVTQAPNDKNQIEPILDKIDALPDELGEVDKLLVDTGYFSAANVAACESAGIEPMIAAGRDLYAPRKQIPEPVFGTIKSVMGFRQFLLRGIDKVRGEWDLVTMAWNMERLFVLCPQV